MKTYKRSANGRNFEYWYDRPYRAWYAMEVDEIGNFGESINAYTKKSIIKDIDDDMVPQLGEIFA